MTPHAEAELVARKTWTLARLGALLNAGRAAGWLPGVPLTNLPDADAALQRVEATEATPMRTLAIQLGLSPVEVDVLWLLACIELEPPLAGAAQLLMSPGMHELSMQVVEQLAMASGCVDGELFERLARFGLIETTLDPRIPLFRRAIRPNDRVIDLARGRLALDGQLREIATLQSAVECRRETANLTLATPRELSRAIDRSDVLVVATGLEGSGRATLLRHGISSSGAAVLTIRTAGLATEHERLTRQLRAIARECRLHGAVPLLAEIDGLSDRVDVVDSKPEYYDTAPAGVGLLIGGGVASGVGALLWLRQDRSSGAPGAPVVSIGSSSSFLGWAGQF